MPDTETTGQEPPQPEAPRAEEPKAEPKAEEGTGQLPGSAPTDIDAKLNEFKASLQDSIRSDLVQAYKAAQRAESKSDLASKKLDQKIERLEAGLEVLATRGMDEAEKRAWVAERALERERVARQDPEAEYRQAAAEFQEWAAPVLAEEGIKPDDPVLTQRFQQLAQGARSVADWKVALSRAIAEAHRAEKAKLGEEAKKSADRAREEERAKLRVERRQGEPPIDRGAPAAPAKVDVAKMSPQDFWAYVERKKREAQR